MILDHPIIGERYFFPRPDPIDRPFWVDAGAARLACHYAASPVGDLTFVHFHGNGEVVADYLPDYVDAILMLGLNVCMVEYRGYGASTGVPALGAMLDDADAVIDALGVPAARLIVYGRSVGSLYALELASRHPEIAGLVLESSIADLHERLLLRVTPDELGVTDRALAAEIAERFDHRAKLAGYRGPLLVMHAVDDDLVDPAHGQRHFQWAGSAEDDKQLVLFDYGGHNALIAANWPRYLGTLEEFVTRVRGRRETPQ